MKNLAFLFSIIVLASGICFAQTSAFTYQGKLASSGAPANGAYQFEFKLFNLAGTQIGTTQTGVVVNVQNGAFSTQLDFGASAFPSGEDRWLEISVRPPGSADPDPYTVLNPRQQINSVPFAVRSLKATNADNATNATTATTAGNVTGVVQVSNGGTGSATQNFIDLTTNQTSIDGDKTFSNTLSGNVVNAATQYSFGGIRVLRVFSPDFTSISVGILAGTDNGPHIGFNSFFGNESGRNWSDGGSNSFFGAGSGANSTTGSENAFFGRNAGAANGTGKRNSYFGTFAAGEATAGRNDNAFFGYNAGLRNNGNSNAFFGAFAGGNAASSHDNAFFGYRAGYSNTASSNSFFGRGAGENNTGGDRNVYVGFSAGGTGTSASQNSFVGYQAGNSNSGSSNTFIGHQAGRNNTTGSFNTAVGWSSGGISGSNNTFIGADARPTAVDLSYATALGADATVSTSNTIVLGRTVDKTIASGSLVVIGTLQLGAFSGAGNVPLCMDSVTKIVAPGCSSSLRYKTNISRFGRGLDLINRLSPITFNWKAAGTADLGLGAEDVEKIEPLLVTYNQEGEVEGVKYDRVGVVLVNAVKEQQTQIESLERQSQSQQKQIGEQRKLIEALRVFVCSQNPTAEICKPNK